MGESLEARLVLAGSPFEAASVTVEQPGIVLSAEGEGGGVLFPTSAEFEVGLEPTSVTTGDFNGDGVVDLATANERSDDVSVLLGNGDGTFQSAIELVIGDVPRAVTSGDFNGDGLDDLATANAFSDDVSVFLSTGGGSFLDEQRLPVGDAPFSITTADFNKDGAADLATTSFNSDSVTVLLGNGDGSFRDFVLDSEQQIQPLIFAVGEEPWALTSDDFNGDGITDLATANSGSDDISILLSNGDGTFQTHRTSDTGESFNLARVLTTGDFDADGILDLAMSDDGVFVDVFPGNGNGTLQASEQFRLSTALSSVSATSVTSGDFNSDGITDIAAATNEGISVLLSNGDGTFRTPQRFVSAGTEPTAIATADFNGDGLTDLSIANSVSDNVTVLISNGNGTFRARQRLGVGSFPISAVTSDFNGNGALDIVTLNAFSEDLSVRLSNGDGTFQGENRISTRPPSTNFHQPKDVTLGDFNNDGLTDIATANFGTNGGSSILLGNGDGTFHDRLLLFTNVSATSVEAGDFNRDGLTDLALQHGPAVRVELNQGDGTFRNYVVLEGMDDENDTFVTLQYTVGLDAVSLMTADFNGDGIEDLVTANSETDVVALLIGIGDGRFEDATFFPVGDFPRSLTTGDFDGNTTLDIAVANSMSKDVSVLFGNGSGGFSAQQRFGTGEHPSSITTGDLNNDGMLDLVTANVISHNVSVLFGNNDGTFQVHQDFTAPSNFVTTGDFDGNGALDLLAGGGFSIDVFLNQMPVSGSGGGDPSSPPEATVTAFDGLDASADLSLTYSLDRDATSPVTIRFAVSENDLLGAGDTIFSTIQIPSGASLTAGEHTFTFDASMIQPLTAALVEPDVQQIFAFSELSAVLAAEADSFAPFRGFYQSVSNGRVVLRTGPESSNAVIAENATADSLDLSFVFSGMTGPREVTVDSPADVLVVSSDTADFIRADPNVSVNTIIRAGNGLNLVVGGAGNDDITGGDDVDVLLGEGFELEVGVLRDLLDDLAMGRIEFAALSVTPVGAGDDKLNGGDGFDVLIGGPGNDELKSGSGGGLLLGDGFRLDTALSLELMPLLQSTSLSDAKALLVNALNFDASISLDGEGQDMIYGGSGIDLVLGGAGDDTFEALSVNEGDMSLGAGLVDIIFGNDGDDTINDRAADFTIAFGGAGDDVLIGGNTGSFLIGGNDHDSLAGGEGFDVLIGDTLDFGVNSNVSEVLSGFGDGNLSVGFAIGPGDPSIVGNDVLSGGQGFDFLVGGYGDDYLEGGAGAGLLFGDSFDFSASLGIGLGDAKESDGQSEENNRTKSGGWLSKALSLFSVEVAFNLRGTGNDTIVGSSGVDLVFGGEGNDKLFSGGGTVDLLFGNEGDDEIRGGGDLTQLVSAVNFVQPDAAEIRTLGNQRRNGDSLRLAGLADSSFSVMVGGLGNDTLVATPVEDSLPVSIGGSVLIGDDFRFEGIPATPSDIFKIEFNGIIPVFFGIQAGMIQEGAGHDILEGARGGFNLLIGGDGDDELTGHGSFDFLMGDSINLGIDVSIDFDFRGVSLTQTVDENFAAIDTSFQLPGLAGNGEDVITGDDGFTIAVGGGGIDRITGSTGPLDLLFGNDGGDSINGLSGFNILVGGDGNDNILGGDDGNVILGDGYSFATPGSLALAAIKEGDLRTGVGLISSGMGTDVLIGGSGFDFVIGGDGSDTIDAGDGFNVVFGDAINLTVGDFDFREQFSEAAKAVIFGDANDVLNQITELLGFVGDGADFITGGKDTDIVFGGGGSDNIQGGTSGALEFDFLVGGFGNDVVNGQAGDDVVFGGPGDDELLGGAGNDHLESEGGADTFRGGHGNDRIFGGAGPDRLFGEAGNDELHGEVGDDLLNGGNGDDMLLGGDGDDVLLGDDGDNLIDGGPGMNQIINNSLAGRPELAEDAVLLANDGAPGDELGDVVSVSGDFALVGAPFDTNERGENAGAAYIYAFDGTNWIQTAKLLPDVGDPSTPSFESSRFGESVSLFGDRALIGAGGTRLDVDGDSELEPDVGAVYVFEFDGTNWQQTAKLVADDAAQSDQFGAGSVSLDGDRALIGAHGVDHSGILFAGAAYVFDFANGIWQQTAELTVDLSTACGPFQCGESFGRRVSLSGDRALVGTDGQADFTAPVYVFELNNDQWVQTATLTASDGEPQDTFGQSISLQGDMALIGHSLFGGEGAAYVFEFNAGDWSEQDKLTLPDGSDAFSFGSAVSLSGNRALIGAQRPSGQGESEGIAYLFELRSVGWLVVAELVASDGNSDFFYNDWVSLSGDHALLGADDAVRSSGQIGLGAAYIFDLSGVAADPTPWQNPTNPLNVDNDPNNNVSPLDVLLIINELNRVGPHELSSDGPLSEDGPFFDVDGDGFVAPIDALLVINFLNSRLPSSAEGEGPWSLSYQPTLSHQGSYLNVRPEQAPDLLRDARVMESPLAVPEYFRSNTRPIADPRELSDLLDDVSDLHSLTELLAIDVAERSAT